MKRFKISYLFFLLGMLLISCENESIDTEVVSQEEESLEQFTVPEIPTDIKAMMSAEDLALFEAGPGKEYLNNGMSKGVRGKHGNWHPILMKLGYNLQFGPFVGESCESPIPCFNENGPTGAEGCENPEYYIGFTGVTVADGYWYSKPVHSMYFPVFCLPDYEGYGEGFYQLDNGMLWLEATNGPFHYDAEGNSRFRRIGQYSPDKSQGVFSGVRGWEIALLYTAAENAPDPITGIGYSDAIIFGWAYW
ncbi:MAG: hypothetical protein WBM98_18255 [Maribacter sp.]|uniref:hypothetical protein n=1 Tax=Maribacter sp. TaxID=1897614 RepID=UPI003C7407CA